MELEDLLRHRRLIRAIGFDDAPFQRGAKQPVAVAGVVCAGTRFEGMVWGQIQPDGWDATDILCNLLLRGISSLWHQSSNRCRRSATANRSRSCARGFAHCPFNYFSRN